KEDYGKTREQITELDISEQDLEEQIACFNNYLTNIIYPDQAEQLTYLDIENNNLPKQDFSVFNRFSNLERLEIGNSDLNKEKINHNIYNRFTGSLEPLKNLTELRQLDISNTDIDSGVEYLPETLENEEEFIDLRDKYEYFGTCKECQQPNEHIADGGFDYNDENRKHKDYKTVALKTLTNSQNLNNEFLTELILYKRFKSEVSNMVPCYGISQDTKGNYIMVMEYMKEGNLKGYLKKNYRELNFEKGEYSSKYLKLNLLKQIALGLKDIHPHDLDLSLKICRGERPQFPPQVKYPQLVVDLIKRCWAADPEQRSTMKEISEIMGEWFYGESGDGENGIYHSKGDLKTDTTFYQQLQEAQAYNKTLPEEIRYLNYQPKEV
ncbi:13154_t:CDS:2, partial [Gigaspora margarita]